MHLTVGHREQTFPVKRWFYTEYLAQVTFSLKPAFNDLKDKNTLLHMLKQFNYESERTSLWGLGGVDQEPRLTSVLSSNVAGIVMFSSNRTAGSSVFRFLGRPGFRPDFGCDTN